MKCKKSIAIIITLILLFLPMMTIPTQAASVGKVYNLTSNRISNIVYFNWDKVTNADGYDLYINTSNKGFEYIGSVTDNTAAVIGFQENKSYTAKVCAYELNSNGTKTVGSFSSTITVSTEVKETLGTVKNLTATQNGGYITLNWSKVNNADGYQVFANIQNFGYVNIGSVTTTNAMIMGAKDGETYDFKVRAYEEVEKDILNYGSYSSSVRIKIDEEKYEDDISKVEKPDRVTGLTIDDVTTSKAYLSWSKVSNADGYEIWLAKENGSYQYKGSFAKTSATLSNLEEDTTYKVKVVSYKDTTSGTVYGPDSAVKTFTTERTESEVDKVKNVTYEVDGNKVYIDWDRVSGADGYEIYMSTSGNRNYKYVDTVSRNSATLRNLDYDQTYYIQIRAFEEVGNRTQYGDFSVYRRFTTDEEEKSLGAVKNLKATVDGKELTVSWSRLSGADGYGVWVKIDNGSYHFTENTTKTTLTTNRLDYGTSGKVKVVAYEERNGRIEYSDEEAIVSFDIEMEELDRPTHLEAEVRNRTEAYLSWWPVEDADGYQVYLSENGRSFKKIDDISKNYMYLYSDTLDYNTRYQVKVVAYARINGKKVYSDDSTTVSFKTEKESFNTSNSEVPRVSNVRANVKGDTVTLTWSKVPNALYYEVDLVIPGLGGSNKYTVYTNSRTISGLTEKEYAYTARVRAYKYVDGRLVSGEYSYAVEFTAK